MQQLTMKRVSGGLLIQDNDQGIIERGDLKIVSKRPPTEKEIEDLLFCVVDPAGLIVEKLHVGITNVILDISS